MFQRLAAKVARALSRCRAACSIHAATATALAVATPLGATAIVGIGATTMAGTAAMAIADTATARIGPTAMELLAAKSAGARCGAQGMFAVSGCIETPNALIGGGLRVAPTFDFPSINPSSLCFFPLPGTATLDDEDNWTSRKASNGQRTAGHGAAAPCDRAPAEDAERITDQSARRARTDKAMRGGEQGSWNASTFPTGRSLGCPKAGLAINIDAERVSPQRLTDGKRRSRHAGAGRPLYCPVL
jgi:hypothetical protein